MVVGPVSNVSGLSKAATATKAEVPVAVSEKTPRSRSSSVQAQVSVDASSLSALYDSANAFVQQAHIVPFAGYDSGNFSDNAFLDVEKYNDYIFSKAAGSMVDDAKEIGVTLNKSDVIKQLKSSNESIANLKNDMDDRAEKLTSGSVLTGLSSDDLSNLTDLYISAKENGVDPAPVRALAVHIGDINKMKASGVTYYSGAQYIIDDEASPPGGIPASVAENTEKLYGHFGLSNMVVNQLADGFSFQTDNAGRPEVFQFLLKMLESNSG